MLQKLKDIITQPTNELGKWSRFAVLQVRIWFHCLRLLKVNLAGTQAAALAYHTIFGVVPLAIVTLMVFQMFPAFDEVSGKLKSFAYDQLNLSRIEYPAEGPDGQEIKITAAQKIEEFSNRFITKVDAGTITVVGVVLVIWASVALLTTIEKTFNNMYHVSAGRSFLHRLFNYWALLTLGPLLVALGIYVSGQVVKNDLYQKFVLLQQQQQQVQSEPDAAAAADPNMMAAPDDASTPAGLWNAWIKWTTTTLLPFMISVVFIFLLYYFLPNTRVSPGAALWGALVAALIWTAAKAAFSAYVTQFVPQFKLYGVLGIIPLTVLWIFLSWLIVLFGLQLTYATQNIKRLDAAAFNKSREQERCFLANNLTIIRLMEYVLNAFERKDQKPVSVEAVAYRLNMPTDFTEKVLNRLVESGLLCHTSEPSIGYVPATDGAHITLDEIARAIGEVSFAQPSGAEAKNMRDVFDQIQRHLSQYTLKQVLNTEETFEVHPDERLADGDTNA